MTARHRLALGIVVGLLAAAAGCAGHREPRSAAPVSARPASIGATLLARRCVGCHAVPRPATMTSEKWLAALERMKRRIELPAADWDTLAALAVGGDTLAH